MEYYGITFSDGSKIEHKDRARHKYLYKKKVNGKWRYFYDIGKSNFKAGSNDRGPDGLPIDGNVRGYTKFQDLMGYDERDRMQRATADYDRYSSTHKFRSYRFGWQEKLSSNKLDAKGKKAQNAVAAYYKTPLGKLELMGDAIKRGKNAIAGLLSNIFRR